MSIMSINLEKNYILKAKTPSYNLTLAPIPFLSEVQILIEVPSGNHSQVFQGVKVRHVSTGLSTQRGERTSAPNTGPSSDGMKVLQGMKMLREKVL